MANEEIKKNKRDESEERVKDEWAGTYDTLAPEEKTQKGILGTGSGKGLTQIIISIAISVIVAWAMVSVVGIPKGTYRADITRLESDLVVTREANADLISQLGDLNGQFNNLSNNLANNYVTHSSVDALTNLPTTVDEKLAAYKTETTKAIDNKFVDYEARIAAMETILGKLELVNEEGEIVTSDETTRWTFQSARLDFPNYSFIELDLDYDRIDQEDLYDVRLFVRNTSSNPADIAVLDKAILELVLQPREYVPINEDDTYLDSDDAPWIDWDANFVIKTREGKEVCRRITFTSEKCNLGTLNPGEERILDLVLELYYKQ